MLRHPWCGLQNDANSYVEIIQTDKRAQSPSPSLLASTWRDVLFKIYCANLHAKVAVQDSSPLYPMTSDLRARLLPPPPLEAYTS